MIDFFAVILAVLGISCISPLAPALLTADISNALSCLVIAKATFIGI